MKRRALFARLAAAAAAALPATALTRPLSAQSATFGVVEKLLTPPWQAWKARHLEPSGRVIDGPQGGSSHSEGQGYGMLIAATLGDGVAFRDMYAWTERNLAIRPDALLAWRWLPGETVPVPDRNNASDGDLFYAWALLRGARRFGVPEYRTRALAIAGDLVRRCIVAQPDDLGARLMLPAVEGFELADGYVFNPSYVMPMAMSELAAEAGLPALAQAGRDGVALMDRLARTGLMPDWIALTRAGPRPAEGFDDHAGYEALRVPLFLIWSGFAAHAAVGGFARAHAAASAVQGTPTVFDRVSGAVREVSADAGYAALAALTRCAPGTAWGAPLPRFAPQQPYYPATLHLFTLLAQLEASPQCTPL